MAHPELDFARSTRNFCVMGLIISWLTGIISIFGGILCLYLSLAHRGSEASFVIPHGVKEVLPLGINVVVTLLNESMGYIHGTSLRWTLHQEDKLTFNSNLRLLSSSRISTPNKWYCNLAFLYFIILSYATPSLIVLGSNHTLSATIGTAGSGLYDEWPENRIKVSGIALIFLGIGLLGQAILATWALVTTEIPTWSSNPLDTVLACIDETNPRRHLTRIEGRCMMSVHQRELDAGHFCPNKRQGPACTAHSEVRWVLALLWVLVPLGALWASVIYEMIVKGNPNGVLGKSWSFLPVFTGTVWTTDSGCPAAKCTAGTSVLNVGWSSQYGLVSDIGEIFLIAAFQCVLTLALHCAELLVNLSRDEGIFRKSISKKGTDPYYNSIIAAFSSWQTMTLFGFKAAVHWLFGLSISADLILGVNMYPPQIFYFTAFALTVAVFATYVSARRPKGSLPATYGHLQTMANLIDEWESRMFWGHKRGGSPCYAGTSAKRLEMPWEGRVYGGKAYGPMETRSFVSDWSGSLEYSADYYGNY